MLILSICAAALIAIALYLEKQRSGAFHSRLAELHEERMRFWRRRLLLADATGDEAQDVRAQSHRHPRRVRQLTDELRGRYREELAGVEGGLGVEHDRELALMEDTLARSTPDAAERDLARQYAAAAQRALARVHPLRGGVVDWAVNGRMMGVGAVVGGYLAYAVPRYFLLVLPPGFSWSAAAAQGAAVGAAAAVLLTQWVGPRMQRIFPGAALALAAAVGTLVTVGRPPSPDEERAVLKAMVAETGCPRATPVIRFSTLTDLSAEEHCALVWRAMSAVSTVARVQAFLETEDAGQLTVARLTEGGPDASVPEAGDAPAAWIVVFSTWERRGALPVLVDKRTGEARAVQPDGSAERFGAK